MTIDIGIHPSRLLAERYSINRGYRHFTEGMEKQRYVDIFVMHFKMPHGLESVRNLNANAEQCRTLQF